MGRNGFTNKADSLLIAEEAYRILGVSGCVDHLKEAIANTKVLFSSEDDIDTAL